MTPSIDIIVCVHNALQDVRDCLSSLVQNKTIEYRLIIVDDGSFEDTERYLKEYAKKYSTLLIRNEKSIGYTKAANQGLQASTAKYVLLLNSDTIVVKCWLEKLIRCMESHRKNGMVGPLSNAAGFQSIPKIYDNHQWSVNPLPQGITISKMANIVASISDRVYPEITLLNGFCYMIHREVINKIGYLDEHHFPIGYGEENDYCIRAIKSGFILRVADDCYVYHKKTRSFSKKRREELSKKGMKGLMYKYTAEELSHYIRRIEGNKTLAKTRQKLELVLSDIRGKGIVYR